jgi:hypothetical protein
MRFFQKLIIATVLFASSQLQAFTPESGFWWNPDESGSGYAIEIQDNYLFVALYVYDEAGNPIWYTAGATLGGNSLFDGELHYTFNGTCIDCNVTQPVTILGERGEITINFLTETTATIEFDGGVVKNIERFNFLLGDEAERMLGEWQTVIDFKGLFDDFPFSGDVLLFDKTSFSDGEKFAEGCRPDNSIDGFCSDFALNNHEMAAVYDYDNNTMLIVVDDSENFWLAYYLDLGLNQFDGEVALYPKGTEPTNVSYPVRGFRSASRSFVETGVGPSKQAKSVNKKVRGIADSLDIELPTKPLSEFSKLDQSKMLRQQTIIQTLIDRLESK